MTQNESAWLGRSPESRTNHASTVVGYIAEFQQSALFAIYHETHKLLQSSESYRTHQISGECQRFETLILYIWGIPQQFDQDLAVTSQIFSVIFYMKVPVEKYILKFFSFFFIFKSFKKKKKQSTLSKTRKNSNKSNEIYKKCWAILEDGVFKTAPVNKNKKLKKKYSNAFFTYEQKRFS